MSTKTLRKRIALVTVAGLGLGLLSVVPAQAAGTNTTLTNSAVRGTLVSSAGGAVTGSFAVDIVELGATGWNSGTVVTLQLLDNNMNADVCTIDTNGDGTPKGAVLSGQSDTLFASAASAPTLAVSSGDLSVTISTTYDDSTATESVTVSGLTATCLSTAATGTIFVKVTAGTTAITGAKVNASGTVVAYDDAVAAATAAAFTATSTTAVPAAPDDNSGVKLLIGSTSAFPLVYEATNCVSVWIGGVGAGLPLTIDGLGYGTDGYAYAMVNDAAADLGVARGVGTAAGQPGTTYAATLTGSCTSVTYIGNIGKVTAAAQLKVDTNKVVSSIASTITTANNDGQIEITELTSGAIADGGATTITVTLTNGLFAAAPTLTTVGAAMTNLTPSYPTNTLTLYRADGTATGVLIHGAISPSATMVAGDSITASATIVNDTNPVIQSTSLIVDGVLTTSRSNKLITFGAATAIASTSGYSIAASTTTAVSGSVITVSESNVGTFGAGKYVAVCFNDAGGDNFSTSSRQIWATVTTGDLKLAGNLTTKQASTGTAAAVVDSATTYPDYNGAAVTAQCAYVQIYSASTVKSTITFNAGNSANTAADTIGAYLTTGSSAGSITMGVFAGSTLAALTAYTNLVYGTRTPVAKYTLSTSGYPSVVSPGTNQPLGDLTIVENKKGNFAVGSITVDLTNSAASQSDPATTWAVSGANAPVVSQTNAASDIAWSYAVTDANTVTITVTTASTNVPATFKVSNILVNVLGAKSNGVAVTDSDLYLTAAGAGLSNGSYSLQAGKTGSAVPVVSNADVLKSIVALIASINKQIQALQKLILARR